MKAEMNVRRILFVTSNVHKFREVRDIASKHSPSIEIKHFQLNYPEIQHEDIEFVAKSSAYFLRKERIVSEPFFIEDSGLFIPALNGFPGAFSSFVFKKIGNEGILKLMNDLEGEQRRAFFKSVIAFSPASSLNSHQKSHHSLHSLSQKSQSLSKPQSQPQSQSQPPTHPADECDDGSGIMLFVGITEGRIAERVRGSGGFGFDPIFEYEGKTFAEMTTEEKNRVSHRGKAVRKFLDYLRDA